MTKKSLRIIILIILIVSFLSVEYATAETAIYSDDFNTFDSSKWTQIVGSWQLVNSKASATGSPYSDLIYDNWEGTTYISEVDFTANDTRISKYKSIGFKFYYKNSDDFANIHLADVNSPDGRDFIGLYNKGIHTFTNTQTYVNTSTNTSIEFDTNIFHNLKLIRLNEKIYVYFDNSIAFTTEFKNENPSGKVGFSIYESTGYFDNFYLRPISMKNASFYLDKLNLTSENPATRIGAYTLRLEDIESGSAMFSLSKFGKTVDTTIAQEGSTVSLNFENGEEGVQFTLAIAMNGSGGGIVKLEDIISASSESVNPSITNISLLPAYYQGGNISAGFSIVNPGIIRYTGTPSLVLNSEGDSVTMNPELNLSANESRNFTSALKAPKTTGAHKLTITLKLDEYTTITKTQDYQVRALNPVITTLSADLRENDGIRGAVTMGSAYPDELVDWNTTAVIEVFRVMENGKQQVYFKEVPVKGRSFDIGISYNDFYSNDGRYLATIKIGEMISDKFFEIKGPDGEYKPVKDEVIPQTVVSNSLYPQLMMLLVGMVAALSVRNHMRPRSWSLPLDLVVVGCGAALFAAGMYQQNTELTSKGMIFAGVGFALVIGKEHDTRINALLMRGSPIHDFIGLILIFMSAAYLILLVPGWNMMLIVGTLIVYYTAINLHGERKKE